MAVVLVAGVILGSVVFPTIKEIPVDRIVEKEVIKRVEIPVEKIVEKRVEIPVERFVDKVVVQRIEILGPEREVVKYVSDRTQQANGKPTYVLSEERALLWKQIKKGMTRKQVVGILGPPDGEPRSSYDSVFFNWGNGSVTFETMSAGGVVKWVTPPEY